MVNDLRKKEWFIYWDRLPAFVNVYMTVDPVIGPPMRTTWPRNPGWRPVDHPQSKTLIERIVTGHDYGVRFEQWDGAGIVERAKIRATGVGVETDLMILATGGLTPEYLYAQRIRQEIVEAAACDEE